MSEKLLVDGLEYDGDSIRKLQKRIYDLIEESHNKAQEISRLRGEVRTERKLAEDRASRILSLENQVADLKGKAQCRIAIKRKTGVRSVIKSSA